MATGAERKKAFVTAMMLLLVTFSGLGALLWAADGVSALGDHNSDEWVIDTEVEIGSDLTCQANITIVDGGVLTVRNATLQMASGTVGNLTIVVGHGGSLILENAEITSYPHTFDAEVTLGILVENGGVLKMTDSALIFPGHMVIDNARLEMHSSSISGVDDVDPNRTHSPVIMGFSADVVMVDSQITDIFTGDASNAAVHFNHTFAEETVLRKTVEYNINRYPADVTHDPDNLTRAFNPGSHYLLPGNTEAVFDGFDLGGLVFDPDEYNLHLNVHYRTVSSDFDTSVPVEYGRDGVLAASTIVIEDSWTADNKNPLQKEKAAITDCSSVELSTMQVSINNTDDVGIEIERIFVSIEGIGVDSYRNITMAGDSSFLAIDSVLPINFDDNVTERNALTLMDSSQAYFYGVTFEDPTVEDAPHGRAVDFIDRTFTALPLEKTANDTTDSLVQNLSYNDGLTYDVSNGLNMSVIMNLSGLPDGIITARIIMDSTVGGSYEPGPVLQYTTKGVKYNTTIVPTNGDINQTYSMGQIDIESLNSTEFSINNDGGDTILIDKLNLELVYKPKLHIYKYADVTVENSLGTPIHGATLTAKEQVGGAAASYLPNDGDASIPSPEVLDRLGRTSDDFNVTDKGGNATIPLLVGTHSNLGDTYHTWEITAESAPGLYELGSDYISFGAYPYLSPELNEDTLSTLSLEGNAAQLELSDPYIVRTDEETMLAVDITNVGDAASYEFNTTFIINGSAMSVTNVTTSLSVNETVTVMQEFVQSAPGDLLVEALTASEDRLIDGVNSSADLSVNLEVQSFISTASLGSELQYGDQFIVFFTVLNNGPNPATDVKVEIFYSEDPGTAPVLKYSRNVAQLNVGNTWSGNADLGPVEHSNTEAAADMNYSIVINNGGFEGGGIPESDYDDNVKNLTYNYVDQRPLLTLEEVETPTHAPYGKTVDIGFTVNNTGGLTGEPVRVTMYLVDGSERIQIVNTSTTSDESPIIIEGDSVFSDTVPWKVNISEGNYTLEAFINEFGLIDVRDDSNNSLTTTIGVDPLEPAITVGINRMTFNSGDQMVVTGVVTNKNDPSSRLSGETVTVAVFRDGVKVAEVDSIANDQGFYVAEITATDNMGGQIEIRSTVTVGNESSDSMLIATVKPAVSVTDQPIWVWLLIIAILIAIIAAFTLYVYRYSLGKMAECGECNSLIPEAARRCPNCGTDFETGTSKCSECNSWIPASSTACPECGASFVGAAIIDEKESEYVQLMREGYEALVDGYRDKIREDLGKKYTDSKFIGLWKEHPEYISFEDWLAREEGKKAEKTFPCSSCGTPNVEGSKNCYRCGHVFEPPKEESARRVVRREGAEEKPDIKTDDPPRKKVVVKRKAPQTKPESEESPADSEPAESKDVTAEKKAEKEAGDKEDGAEEKKE